MKKRMGLLFIFLLLTLFFSGLAFGVDAPDYLVFSQVVGEKKVIYTYEPEALTLNQVVSGPNPVVFLEGKYFIYFNDQKLSQYDVVTQETKELASLKEQEVDLEVIPDGPEQALVVAKDGFNVNWYVLELSDGSLRRISSPPVSSSSGAPRIYSPDRNADAVIKTTAFAEKVSLAIEEKINGKFKNTWSLPQDLTIVPDWPVWSPDSQRLAFYGKETNGFEGFYSLYLLDLTAKKMKLVEEQVFAKFVFSKIGMRSFKPSWSGDSKYLVFQTQPNGLPNRSSIVKYEVATEKKQVLTNSSGKNNYPTWSVSDRYISFLSERENEGLQLYIMDQQGTGAKRVSPREGTTEWAKWYRIGK